MNNLKKTLIALSLCASPMASTPVEKPIPVTGLYSPRGYDTMDSSEIVVAGYLPNGCHKNPKVEISKNGRFIDVRVRSLFYQSNNPYCPEVLLPFVKTVNVGLLKAGEYKVRLKKQTTIDRIVPFVVKNPDGSDDKNQVYANVQHIERKPEEGKIILFGHNPSDCFVFDRINVVDNGRKTITVLPKMKQVSQHCPMKMVPFKYEVSIPKDDDETATLIHVRTMYGDSINTIY
ncbi:MAG: hypothetical protein NXH75_00770 [Halobacteriovoraceae bacterium]|nr:hypothetical protein [Halobacteriovoraceae bacterium]